MKINKKFEFERKNEYHFYEFTFCASNVVWNSKTYSDLILYRQFFDFNILRLSDQFVFVNEITLTELTNNFNFYLNKLADCNGSVSHKI